MNTVNVKRLALFFLRCVHTYRIDSRAITWTVRTIRRGNRGMIEKSLFYLRFHGCRTARTGDPGSKPDFYAQFQPTHYLTYRSIEVLFILIVYC